MSLSLIAVFIPIFLYPGLVGRFFREFTMTLSTAIVISMVISLTTTPMMCALFLGRHGAAPHRSGFHRWSQHFFDDLLASYDRSLQWALRHGRIMMLILAAAVGLNVLLFARIPKGFFPEQDTGLIQGGLQADQSSSFQRTSKKMKQFIDIVEADPAVETAVGTMGGGGFGGGGTNTAQLSITLKPLAIRQVSSEAVITRLRPKLAQVAGATLFLAPVQDIRTGGRQSNSLYQYTLQADELADLQTWTPKLLEALQNEPILKDLNSDQQNSGLETDLVIDRDTASRLGLTASQVDNTLYDAFGQRQVSTIYQSLNQYHVVMVVAPRFWQNPASLDNIYVSTSGGAILGTQGTNAVAGTVVTKATMASAASVATDTARNAALNSIAATGKSSASTGQAVSTRQERMIPLAAFAHYQMGMTPLAVNHQGQFAAATISFNMAAGHSLSEAVEAINRQAESIHMPASVHGSFQGTALTYQQSVGGEPLLIVAAIVAIYIVLGVLYESYAHPLTILSTLPSAGVGAVLALMLFKAEFSLIALIGVILLIGIVKKNAIMMIDFAIDAERNEGLSPREAIYKASLLRFRPIMMTTMAALLGAVPLAIGQGNGAEIRQPLGISIVGGLILSQLLTLYTTPVVYLYVDRARLWFKRLRSRSGQNPGGEPISAKA
jgi:multidrug efflux pump